MLYVSNGSRCVMKWKEGTEETIVVVGEHEKYNLPLLSESLRVVVDKNGHYLCI